MLIKKIRGLCIALHNSATSTDAAQQHMACKLPVQLSAGAVLQALYDRMHHPAKLTLLQIPPCLRAGRVCMSRQRT
jgi:hypothetical protein